MRLLAAWLVLLYCFSGSANGQQTSVPFSADRVDVLAYRTLFRQAILYRRLATTTASSQNLKPDFGHILARRFRLNEDDNASLERLALAYQGEVDPLQKRIVQVIKSFQSRFPDGVVRPGISNDVPPELIELQQEQDTATLRYRDLLRNSMREDAYQVFHAELITTFGRSLQ